MYSKCKAINYDGYNCLETRLFQNILPKESDTYFKVTVEYENRLDLISYKVYGNCEYFWVIALVNNISNPLCVPLNSILRIPSTTSLLGILKGGD